MRTKLGHRVVKTLKPGTKPYEVVDADIRGFLLRVQPSGSMTYYLAYRTPGGKKKRYKIGRHGTINAIQARDLAEQYAAKILGGQDVQAEKKRIRLEMENAKTRTLGTFLRNKYGPWVEAERKTGKASLQRVCINFSHLDNTPLENISVQAIELWRSEQLRNGKAAATVNRDIAALKAALSKAIDWEIITSHPLQKLKKVKTDDKGIVRYLSKDEEKQLRIALDEREQRIKDERNSANQWRQERSYPLLPDFNDTAYVDYLKPMVLLTMNTGLRRGELLNLKWQHVDFNSATLILKASTTKSNRTRYMPLNKESLNVLAAWRAQTEGENFIFCNPNGNQLTHCKRSWATVLKLAKIKNFRWHDLRHHFASKLVMASVDLNTVRELLGHSDIEMTLRYAHLAPEHKAEAVARLGAS
jgi:integrase